MLTASVQGRSFCSHLANRCSTRVKFLEISSCAIEMQDSRSLKLAQLKLLKPTSIDDESIAAMRVSVVARPLTIFWGLVFDDPKRCLIGPGDRGMAVSESLRPGEHLAEEGRSGWPSSDMQTGLGSWRMRAAVCRSSIVDCRRAAAALLLLLLSGLRPGRWSAARVEDPEAEGAASAALSPGRGSRLTIRSVVVVVTWWPLMVLLIVS